MNFLHRLDIYKNDQLTRDEQFHVRSPVPTEVMTQFSVNYPSFLMRLNKLEKNEQNYKKFHCHLMVVNCMKQQPTYLSSFQKSWTDKSVSVENCF